MKHQIISKEPYQYPYSLEKVKLIAESEQEKLWISSSSREVHNYLTLELGGIEITPIAPPVYQIKRFNDGYEIDI